MPQRLPKAALALNLAIAAPAHAQPPSEPPEEQQLVVTGERMPIFVTGTPRCRPLPGDPLDAADVTRAHGAQQVLRPDEIGVLAPQPDDDPITGPETWQRAGTAIRDYVFRAPLDGTPLCIGAARRRPDGFAQLRRVQDAAIGHGRYARFTAWVATRATDEVRLWLAVGDDVRVMRGGDTSGGRLDGNRGWTPVMLTIGPIPEQATKLSYGFLLMGRGDVWLTEPRLEILEAPPPGLDGRGVYATIGRDHRGR